MKKLSYILVVIGIILCLNCVVYILTPKSLPLPISILITIGIDMIIVGGAINGGNDNR